MIQEQQPKLGFFDFQFGRSYYAKLLLILLLEVIVFVSFNKIIDDITYGYMLLFISCALLCIAYFSLYLISYIRESNTVLPKIYEKIHTSFKFYGKGNHQVSLKVMIIILIIKIILFSSLCYFIINLNYYQLHNTQTTEFNSFILFFFRSLNLVRFRDDYEILIKIVILLQFSLFVFTVYIIEYLYYSYKKRNGKKSLIIGLILLLLSNLLTLNIMGIDPIPYQCDWIREKDNNSPTWKKYFDTFESYDNEDYQVCRNFVFTNNPYILGNLIINTLQEIREQERKSIDLRYSVEDDFALKNKIFYMIYFNEKLKRFYFYKSGDDKNYIALKYKIPSAVSRYTEVLPWKDDYYYWNNHSIYNNINEFHKVRDKNNKTQEEILELGDVYFSIDEYDIAEQYYLQYKKPEVIGQKLKQINTERNKSDDNQTENYRKIIYDIMSKGYTSETLARAYFDRALQDNYGKNHFLYLSMLYAVESVKEGFIRYSDIKSIRDFILQYDFGNSGDDINEKLRKNDFNKLVEMYVNNESLTKMFAEYYYYYLKFTFRYDSIYNNSISDPREWADPNNTLYDPNAIVQSGKIVFNNEAILQKLKSNPYATELVKAMEEEREKVKNSIRYEVLLKLQKEGIEFTR